MIHALTFGVVLLLLLLLLLFVVVVVVVTGSAHQHWPIFVNPRFSTLGTWGVFLSTYTKKNLLPGSIG